MSARGRIPWVVTCAVALVALKLGLLLFGFGRVFGACQRLVGRRGAGAAPTSVLSETARRVALVSAFFPGRALCLEQSLTLWVLLRRSGVDADLRLGVRPYPFGAHAWVEHRTRPVNEDPELVRSFVTLPSFAR